MSLLLLSLIGCGPDDTVIDGSFGGKTLDEPGTVMWGGPFVIFTDEILSCYDVDFFRRIYDLDEAPTDFDFAGLQFAFDDDDAFSGIFDVSGNNAAVAAKGLVVEGGAFAQYRASAGQLEITSSEDQGLMEGSFSVDFDEDGSLSTTYFSAEWCNNLVRN